MTRTGKKPDYGKKGNKNALKHGLYAKREAGPESEPTRRKLMGIEMSVLRLEETQEMLIERIRATKIPATWMQLTFALVKNCNSIFNGYRTMAFLNGSLTPMDQALEELKTLDFNED